MKLIPYLLFALFINTLGIFFYIDTLDMTEAAYQLPRILIVIVSLLTVLMLLERYLIIKKERSIAREAETQSEAGIHLQRLLLFILFLTVYVMTIKPLGYFIATPLYIAGTLYMLKATRLSTILGISLIFTVFVYLVFVQFLHMPVPMGLMA